MPLICYCYNYTEDEIRRDVHLNKGTSTILLRILEEKKKGNCDCKTMHPEGR